MKKLPVPEEVASASVSGRRSCQFSVVSAFAGDFGFEGNPSTFGLARKEA
jgi:hypothetical protein